MVDEVAPLGLPMHRRRVQASGGETMKPLLRPLFTAMGTVMITGSIGQPMEPLAISLGSIWSSVWLATLPRPRWPTVIPENLSVSSHLNNFFQLCDKSLLSEDPEGNKVRSLHFTQLPPSYHMCGEVWRGVNKTRHRLDAHDVGPRAPCRTRATGDA